MKKNKKDIKKIFICTLILFGTVACNNELNVESEDKEYIIDFYSDGQKVSEQKVKRDELVIIPENPIKEGYIFSHWATHDHSIDGSEKFDFSVAPNRSETLFAHFEIEKRQNENLIYGYEEIYNQYSNRLKLECPTLSISECANLSNEGISKMAEYMIIASGIDGQYETYEKWASKLMDIYLQEAR